MLNERDEVQSVYLVFPNAGSRIVVKFGHLVDVDPSLEVQLVPEGHEAAECGRLCAPVPLIQEKDRLKNEVRHDQGEQSRSEKSQIFIRLW